MTLNEVAPPAWGHTKAEKEKTKPNKPKSKIGGSAAAFKRALDDGRFKGLPGDKTKKEKTASMFKLMWAMKKKGAKPHYKPGTDKKYKKYQDEAFGFTIDSGEHKKASKKSKMRNLAKGNTNPNEKAAAEKKAGGPKLYGEEATFKQRDKELKKTSAARNKRYKDLHKKTGDGNIDVNETNEYEKLKKKIGSKIKHNKPAIKEGISYQDFITRVKG